MQYLRSNSEKSPFTGLFRFFWLLIITIFFTTTTKVEASTWVVRVGDGGLKFDPAMLTVAPNDTITFNFLNGPHGVTQSTGPKSCSPLNGGFKTDSRFVSENYSIKVVGKHCAQGMTGTINVVAADSVNNGASTEQVGSTATSVVLSDASNGKGSTSVLAVTIGVLTSSFFIAIMLV
ncbi:8712_t:CDS:2 [Ambispora gerdemannii]|uniref:8712_t:CDS:1 n=1 Tax=Ambispora gerdemannii TaxID=144530 RepID=A0A9N8Z878_9GLOM|nr:8712_t:CDS:2 [Ambispora gerdemannii]